MTSSILDLVLLAALAGTSGAVLLMYRRLKRFDALQSTAAVAFGDAAAALDRAREAMRTLHDEGGDMAVTLAARLNEARLVMNDIDGRSIEALRIELVPQAAPPAPAPTASPATGTDDALTIAAVAAEIAPSPAESPAATVTPLRPRPVTPDAPARDVAAASRNAPPFVVSTAAPVSSVAPVAPAPTVVRADAAVAPASPAPAALRSAGPAAANRATPGSRPTFASARSGATAAARLAAAPAVAAAVPQPAPSPLPPRVGSPAPLRAPSPRPRVEEPRPTLHRAPVTAPARVTEASEPAFVSRGITLADLARAARGSTEGGPAAQRAAAPPVARRIDLAHA